MAITVFTGKDLSEGVEAVEKVFLTTKIKLTIDNKTETTQRGLKCKHSPSDILFINWWLYIRKNLR